MTRQTEDKLFHTFFAVCIISVLAMLGYIVFGPKHAPRPCSSYADVAFEDLPARCIEYWTLRVKP